MTTLHFTQALKRLLYLSSLIALIQPVHAQDKNDAKTWWFTAGGFSYHFANRDQLNQTHPGIGVEYHWLHDIAFVAGTYKNSNYNWSQYLGANWMPLQLGRFKLGATAQVANKYNEANNGGAFVFAAPTLSLESRHVGANLYVIPTIANVTGAVAVQFKFSF